MQGKGLRFAAGKFSLSPKRKDSLEAPGGHYNLCGEKYSLYEANLGTTLWILTSLIFQVSQQLPCREKKKKKKIAMTLKAQQTYGLISYSDSINFINFMIGSTLEVPRRENNPKTLGD